jgi:hypothetical protein
MFAQAPGVYHRETPSRYGRCEILRDYSSLFLSFKFTGEIHIQLIFVKALHKSRRKSDFGSFERLQRSSDDVDDDQIAR